MPAASGDQRKLGARRRSSASTPPGQTLITRPPTTDGRHRCQPSLPAASRAMPPEPAHPFRVRTVTAFLHLAPDPITWEAEVAAAGAFLAHARSGLEAQGYEVQTTRIATQPFERFLDGCSTTDNTHGDPEAAATQLIANAQLLESLAARHGIALVSIGSSSQARHLPALPRLIAATAGTSCTFALPADASWELCDQVAAAVMEVARLTGGMGNFRFASASNMQPGIPFFPVAACGGPAQHRCFAIGTESDALLHQAFAAAAAAGGSAAGQPASGLLAAAQQQLHDVLHHHLAPLEAAALQLEAAAAAADGGQLQPFRYLGLDTSLAPGLDTPALTASYELLLSAGLGPQPAAGDSSSSSSSQPAIRFGGPGSLTVSAAITRVLKGLPLRLTGYCGLMLAVCEDQGLAAAAAAGSITISQLLQYSAVCGCGLDTVPVPGPASGQNESSSASAEAAAAAADAATTAAIAGLVSDVNSLAHRLGKPLACRLLPLPGKAAGEPTGFSHPFMINSHVMDLST